MTKPALVAILHLGIDGFHHSLGIVVLHILVAAKTMIARHWTENLAPNPSEAVYLIIMQLSLEQIYSHVNSTCASFKKLWKPWMDSKYYFDVS